MQVFPLRGGSSSLIPQAACRCLVEVFLLRGFVGINSLSIGVMQEFVLGDEEFLRGPLEED